MKKLQVWAGAILVGSASACAGNTPGATVPSSAAATASTEAPDAEALFARESTTPLHPVPITVLAGAVSSTVNALSAPKMRTEENEAGELISIVDVPIGTKVPLTCIFRTERIDPGIALQKMLTPVASAPTPGGEPFSPDVKVTVAEGVPVLSVTAAFVEKGEPLLAKVAVAATDGGTVICTHFEAGYRATFARHVERIVGSLKYATPTVAPRWHEVRLHELGTGNAYVELDVFEGDKPGQSVSRSFFSGYVKVKGQWLGVDGASSETYETRGGAVLDKTTAFYVAGTRISEVKLTRTHPGEYAYKGTVHDADVDGTFKSRSPITTDASRAAQVRSWLSGRKSEARFETYDELENAKGTIGVVFKREAGRTVTVETLGAKTSTHRCTIDAQGLFESEEEPGAEGTRETRLFGRGTL
jgi:hypothetical protein